MIRNVIRSTPPASPATSITSPMSNWFSIRRKKPEITSFTSDCDPNETASPITPAPARIGPMSMKASRVRIVAKTRTRIPPTPRRMPEMVDARFSPCDRMASSPSSAIATIRRASSFTIWLATNASAQIRTILTP